MKLTKGRFFEKVGAPLRSVRASWGGRGESFGKPFILLGVWSDTRGVLPTREVAFQVRDPFAVDSSFGALERVTMLDDIAKGVTGFVVVQHRKGNDRARALNNSQLDDVTAPIYRIKRIVATPGMTTQAVLDDEKISPLELMNYMGRVR